MIHRAVVHLLATVAIGLVGSTFERSLTVLNGAELTAEFPCRPNCGTSSLPGVAREAWLIWRRHPDAQSYTLAEASPCLVEANRLPTDTVALVRIMVSWQQKADPPVTCDVRVHALRDGQVFARTQWVRIRIRRIYK